MSQKSVHPFNSATFLEIVLLLLLKVSTISSREYGPPILSLARSSSLSATELPYLSTTNNARYFEEKILYLENFPNYATVLPITDGRSWIKSEELVEILGKESPNEGYVPFTVTPPEGYGIMVVIQELQIPAFNTFNRSLLIIDENGKIIECFSKFVFQIKGKAEVDVCGRTNDHLQSHPSSLIDGVGPRSFVVPVGKSISVKFVYRDEAIDQSPSLYKQVPFYDMGYLFRAAIAFTAYKACPHGPPFYNENKDKVWPCDIPQSNHEAVAACIPEDLFCDNTINCGMHDSKEFAVDERFCKEKVSSNNHSHPASSLHSHSLVSPRKKHVSVDTSRLEEAIRNRVINSNRPFGYNDMVIQMGSHSGKGSNFISEPVDKPDNIGHPAFVALIILITIICVLIVGLIFRYCCKPCVGKSDPFGESSNPEAVARFHENLRSRDNDANGTPGRPYGISFDSLVKPVEDLPPSYTDLFPQDVNDQGRNTKIFSITPTSQVTTSNTVDSAVVQTPIDSSPLPVYSLPVSYVAQETSSRSINASRHNPNSSSQSYFVNPAFIQVLPGNREISLGVSVPVGVTVDGDQDSLPSSSHQNHSAYRVNT